MSKAAVYFLLLAASMGALVMFAPVQSAAVVGLAKLAFGVLLGLFVVALALGRRIKFDPILR